MKLINNDSYYGGGPFAMEAKEKPSVSILYQSILNNPEDAIKAYDEHGTEITDEKQLKDHYNPEDKLPGQLFFNYE